MFRLCLVVIISATSFLAVEGKCKENPCVPSPCFNEGVCSAVPFRANRFTCTCSDDFEGFYCEQAKDCGQADPCNPTPCLNGGVCSPTGKDGESYERYTCACPKGTSGLDCELTVEPDPCMPSPCINHQICERKPSNGKKYTCTCPQDYAGCKCDILRPKGCPAGYEQAPGTNSCYKIVTDKRSYDAAEQICNKDYPQFASGFAILTTTEENVAVKNFLIEKLKKAPYDQCKDFGVWFGLKRTQVGACKYKVPQFEPSFAWKSSASCSVAVENAYWNTGEPNCGQDTEDCAHMAPTYDYKWNDLQCSTSCCSLCEVNL